MSLAETASTCVPSSAPACTVSTLVPGSVQAGPAKSYDTNNLGEYTYLFEDAVDQAMAEVRDLSPRCIMSLASHCTFYSRAKGTGNSSSGGKLAYSPQSTHAASLMKISM